MHATAISVVSTVRRTDETPTPTRTHVEESASASKPVNHSNGPQCAHCGWRGGGHAVIAPTNPACYTVVGLDLFYHAFNPATSFCYSTLLCTTFAMLSSNGN
ncbi:hypothetical protein B0H14DRAFT_3150971 [Mycena olivaceomarginata]|nr:hypothetical protein B0H14DRAFT_3150971 [Mycena olivaceomarginata]